MGEGKEMIEALRAEVEDLRRENAFLRDVVAAYHAMEARMAEMARRQRREPEAAS